MGPDEWLSGRPLRERLLQLHVGKDKQGEDSGGPRLASAIGKLLVCSASYRGRLFVRYWARIINRIVYTMLIVAGDLRPA